MSTITSVEQDLPVSIQLLSRISTYAHVFESVLAIVLFSLFPSLSPKLPERQITFRPRNCDDSSSINSTASTVSTLIEEDMTDREDSKTGVDKDTIKSRRFSILSAPMVKSKSLSLVPFARRMSLPAKRFSEHFTTTLSSPFQTSHPSPLQSPHFSPFDSPPNSPVHTPFSELEPTFPSHYSDHVHFEDEVRKEGKRTDTVVEVKQLEEVEYFEMELSREPVIIIKKETIQKVRKITRVAKKAKSFLRIRRQS